VVPAPVFEGAGGVFLSRLQCLRALGAPYNCPADPLPSVFCCCSCDGSEPERRYFGKVADATPQDTMILTLGCGKFRFYDHDYGMLPNTQLPRMIDMGQCNDAYSGELPCSLPCPAALQECTLRQQHISNFLPK
jgi:hypothetical protein